MRGQQNIKICNAKQAKEVYQYKNFEIKLYKNNAAIWYNKTCRIKQPTLTYLSLNLCTGRPLTDRTIPDAASIQFNLLMMSI